MASSSRHAGGGHVRRVAGMSSDAHIALRAEIIDFIRPDFFQQPMSEPDIRQIAVMQKSWFEPATAVRSDSRDTARQCGGRCRELRNLWPAAVREIRTVLSGDAVMSAFFAIVVG